MRGVAVVAIALTSVVSLAACAKDSAGSGGGGSTTSQGAGGCKYTDPPKATAASTTTTSDKKVDASGLKVGLAYDIGGRGDASFNDAAAHGLDRAKAELGVKDVRETTATPNESDAAKEARLRQLAQDGYNPIVTVGYAYGLPLANVAKDFPGTRFAIVDSTVDNAPNVTPLTFTEEQGSFLVGVIAAYKSKACHVGFVGGVQVPLIQKFQAGFDLGAKTAAPGIKIEDQYITPAGDPGGYQDPPKGRLKAQGELSAGADVIYQAAGNSGKGIFQAVKEKGNAYAIGVDSDQYKQPTLADYRDVIISSMIKSVDLAVFDYLRAVAGGDLATLPKVFDLAVGGVGYATSGGRIDDIRDIVEAYKAEIISGGIKVPTTPAAG